MKTRTAWAGASAPGRSDFVTTHWSVVLAAGANQTRAEAALATLCESYWYPLYAYVRRRGHSPEDAQDLTQEFFAQFLSHNWVENATPARGRFRTFLLTALSRFLANQWDRSHAQKRGGDAPLCSLDAAHAEGRFQAEPATALIPDSFYDRQWALTLLERTLGFLAARYDQAGKAAQFAALKPWLSAQRGAIPYACLSACLGCTEPAVRQEMHRLRKQFRDIYRAEILKTVESPAEVEDEMRHLLAALAG